MATQRIAIAEIVGAAAGSALDSFRWWLAARLADECEPDCMSPDQWPRSIRRNMQKFAAGVRAHSDKPPIVFFAECIDMWSMGDVYAAAFPEDGAKLLHVMADDVELLCYALPDGGKLQTHLTRRLRRRSIRERSPQETRWYLLNLMEACVAWEGLVGNSALVILRQTLGGLVEDYELRASLDTVPGWCRTRERRSIRVRK